MKSLSEFLTESIKPKKLPHIIHEICLQLMNNEDVYKDAVDLKAQISSFIKSHPDSDAPRIFEEFSKQLHDLSMKLQRIVGVRVNRIADSLEVSSWILHQILIMCDNEDNVRPYKWSQDDRSLNDLQW